MENNKDFTVNKKLREDNLNRVDVLEKVKGLILLSKTEYATVKQVAEYYEVGVEAINSLVKDNREEVSSNGMKTLTGIETKEFLVKSQKNFTNHKGYFSCDGEKFANRSNLLFSKRAILNVGMLLRDSEVAKEVRRKLLDVVHDVEMGKDNIMENLLKEMSEEQQLMLQRVQYEFNGEYEKVNDINAKLFALKNKRIKELEEENEIITTHSLTIIESKQVINRILRTIASKKYSGMFGKAWADFYSKVNYQLHINVEARKGKGLNRFSDEEIFKLEEIARTWAVKNAIDVKSLLSLS